jgi:serine/threonine protein kinase/WD40 repeat protein
LAAELEAGSESETLAYLEEGYAPRSVLGKRYRIRSILGRGGMGEVWRAFDLKLRVDVALKALRPDWVDNERALETLRQEVRSAREVVSPNVCRVFDLVELDGRELVSMEYIDGITLWEILRARAPLDLTEARDIALQFLAGLEAIHAAGLVHRDIKPENLMITRSGRVVVMDFGIAKGLAEGRSGPVAGTPAYMAPEQARGEAVTSRADVFSAGVVLAEMVAPGGLKTFEDRQRLWQGIHRDPPEVGDTAWAPVIAQAVAVRAGERHAGASALTRALEEVTLRVAGAETARPYPGLASFTEEDAEYFFGRELEVEEMWKRLPRTHLAGLIGPSGAGKSSFLRAGLLPVLPTGWSALVATPGTRPFTALARALLPELAGDTDAMEKFLRFEELKAATDLVSRWREQHDEVLLIIDQFEELFTQNPPEVQDRFAELLGHLAVEADVHVLLSMRDDFLFRCSEQPALGPMFSELTPLRPPLGTALRRALVEPALKCGYRFEDEAIIEEMIGEVTAERGALPLLAFAAARLWEHRDREAGLLTREAYEQIGGVGGALSQHAEATLERVGHDHLPVVREIFRNLVTAEGTRAARDQQELLSVFEEEERADAEEVLTALVDARLLTTFEQPTDEEEGVPRKRIEIIHESLLSNWPRLVRWRTQDADSAQLRDQLRQAAQLWIERGKPEDLLWTGTSFKDFELWRERYEGGLTETEGEFADAMTRTARQQKQRRRLFVAAAFALLLAVAASLAIFWLRSEWARREAVAAEQQAQASNLYGLARIQPEEEPTAFLAYATASLEQADNAEVRREIVKALWKGPPGFRLPVDSRNSLDFSPDGRWLATASRDVGIRLWPSDGGPPTVLEGSTPGGGVGAEATTVRFSPQGDLVAHTHPTEGASSPDQMQWREVVLWSVPEVRPLRSLTFEQGNTHTLSFSADGDRLFTITEIEEEGASIKEVRSWPVSGGEPSLLARLDIRDSSPFGFTVTEVDPTGTRLVWTEGGRLFLARSDGSGFDLQSATELNHPGAVAAFAFNRQGNRMVTGALEDGAVRLRIWSLEDGLPQLKRTVVSRGAENFPHLDATASRLVQRGAGVWDLRWPPDAEPLPLRFANRLFEGDVAFDAVAFDPGGRWIATGNTASVSFWPLERPYPHVLRGHDSQIDSVRYTPDGRWLVSASRDGTIRLWPFDPDVGARSRVLHREEEGAGSPNRLAVAPDGSFIAFGTTQGRVAILPLDGGTLRELQGFSSLITTLAVGPQGRLVAAGGGYDNPQESFVRIWDLESGDAHILDHENPDRVWVNKIRFTAEGHLLVETSGTRRWDLTENPPRLLRKSPMKAKGVVRNYSPDGRLALVTEGGAGPLVLHNVDTGTSRRLGTHSVSSVRAIFDPSGKMILSAGSEPDGPIFLGPISGEEPYLFYGHETPGLEGLLGVDALAVSPDGRSLASGGLDGTIRVWPMPDLDLPPLQALPREELIAKLKTLTNLQVVPEPESFTGWKLEIGPFPGWEEVPKW